MSLILVAISLASGLLVAPAESQQVRPLQIGDPAPSLGFGEFVAGQPVAQLEPGHVYVIELGATSCVPCIDLMPHFHAVQQQYPELVLISVFLDNAQTVREFLKDRRPPVNYRLTVDRDHHMWQTWSEPAYQSSLPHAFIVGRDLKVAWIGHPGTMDTALDQIIHGTFDPSESIQRLALEQGVALAKLQQQQTAEEARDEYHRLNQMTIAGELQSALRGTRDAIVRFADATEQIELFRGLEVYLMVRIPEEQDQVVRTSQQYAIHSCLSGEPLVMFRCAAALLNAAGPEPPCRNQSLVDLAEALLQSEALAEPAGKPIYRNRVLKLWKSRAQAQAYFLEGDAERAALEIQQVVDQIQAEETSLTADERRVLLPHELEETDRLLQKYAAAPAPVPLRN